MKDFEIIEGINSDLKSWELKRTEFKNLKTYSEKLIWWDDNILSAVMTPTYQILAPDNGQNYEIGCLDYYYTNEFGNLEIVLNRDNILISGYLTIIPHSFADEKQQFWDWLIQKINGNSIEYFEKDYKERLGKVHPLHYVDAVNSIQNELDTIEELNNSNYYFMSGINYSIFKDISTIDFLGEVFVLHRNVNIVINSFIEGYKYKLKRTAFDLINNIQKSEIEGGQLGNMSKIKWLGTPSQFSYLFLELVKKGFIEQPLFRSETSPSRYAELCYNNFDIDTTLESLKTEFKRESSLGSLNRSKFIIPEKDDVTDKRSGTKVKKTKIKGLP